MEEGEQYYLVETQVPDGYNSIAPIPVRLALTDVYTQKPGTATQNEEPETGIFDWTQNVSLVLDSESGVKRTNAENTENLTYSTNASPESEIIYYRVVNNPGVELPSTGGPGTGLIYLLGFMLTGLAGAVLLMKRRRRNAA